MTLLTTQMLLTIIFIKWYFLKYYLFQGPACPRGWVSLCQRIMARVDTANISPAIIWLLRQFIYIHTHTHTHTHTHKYYNHIRSDKICFTGHRKNIIYLWKKNMVVNLWRIYFLYILDPIFTLFVLENLLDKINMMIKSFKIHSILKISPLLRTTFLVF